MNPGEKCIQCQNPWGGFMSCTDDEYMDTDVETFAQDKDIKEK